MNKKPIAILLIFVWILQAVSPAFFYATGRWAIQVHNFNLTEEESEGMNKETLHFASLTDIVWEDEDKEIKFNGELYDVLAIEYPSEGIDIICFSDEKETNIAQLAITQNENDHSDNGILKQVFKDKIIVEQSSFKIHPGIQEFLNVSYQFTTVIDPIVSIYVPPPQA